MHMSLELTMHNVSGHDFNCFYRAIFNALSRSGRLLAEIGCDRRNENNGVKCLRGKVADMVRTSSKARTIVKSQRDLARSGYIESDTIMAKYEKMFPNKYLTDTLAVTLERFAYIITTQKVMTDSLDFLLMDNWLNKFDVALFNITYANARSSNNLIKILTRSKQERVILISTDNVHYNWVSFRFRIHARKFSTGVLINRKLLLNLLATGDPDVKVHKKEIRLRAA